MRISTNTLFDLGVNSINSQLAELVRTQQQVASGRRILTPSDDPVASSAVVETERSLNITTQHLQNISNARSTLSLEESVTSNINRVYQQVRQTVVSAGNAALNATDRATLATTLRSNYDELLSLANSRDGQGEYLFAGFKTNTQPFTQTTGAAVYAGDQGQRKLQITPSRQINISDSGQDLFKPGVTGNDPFQTIENFITALTAGGPVSAAAIDTAINGIDAAQSNALRVQTTIGSRLNELDSTEITGQDTSLQHQTTLSNLRDVDLTKAISDLTRQQAGLEAAQRSFVNIQGLSLFNFL